MKSSYDDIAILNQFFVLEQQSNQKGGRDVSKWARSIDRVSDRQTLCKPATICFGGSAHNDPCHDMSGSTGARSNIFCVSEFQIYF